MSIKLSDHFTYSKLLRFTLPSIAMMIFTSIYGVADGFFVSNFAGKTPFAAVNLIMPFLMMMATVGFMFGTGGSAPIIYFARKNGSILRLGKTSLDKKAILKACTNGSSELMSNISMSLVGMLYNIQLIKYAGENGIAAYGVMMYVSMIFSGAFIGYSIGTAPVVSFHYGAQNQKELKSLLRKSLIMIAVFGLLMVAMAEVLAIPLAKIFVGYDKALMDLTVSGFRIFGLSFVFMGFAIFVSGFFTALNDGLTSALISFLRTLVFQVAAVFILPLIFDINGVWLSIVVAELMAVLLGIFFLKIKQPKYKY